MTSTLSELPTVPEIGLEPPPSKLASKAFSYAKQHCTEAVYNHTIRSAYWALIIAKKLPEFSQNAQLNLDAVIIGCILHDIGWAKTPELLSTDKRFEVDGANIARDFIKNEQNQMNADGLMSEAVIQRVWDAIALHATGSIARHAAPEVALTNLGVAADFAGPSLRGPDDMALITSQEYHAIMTVFPRAGFNRDGFKEIMCWLCRTKPKTTYDNWVGSFGRNFGTNGVGAGREEYGIKLTMQLSNAQIDMIAVAGRVCSALSALGTITIIVTFCCSRYFRNPIHRIIFFNAFYNLLDSVATMISVSGPGAGNSSALCQFQGFALQMFPLADVLWTFAMAMDTYLVVFYHFDAHSLRKLEMKYIGAITTLTFIPALVFLFIQTPEKGPIYGSETIWCSISAHWMLIRLILYYIPVWLTIAIVMVIYCLIGIEISRLRDELNLSSDDHIALTSISADKNPFDGTSGTVTIVESDPPNKPPQISTSQITRQSSVECTSTPLASSIPIRLVKSKSPKQKSVSFKEYILMPSLFFLALLATWVTPTINRVSTFIHPDYQSYSLLLAVSALGSLRGFWNGIIFITVGVKGWRRRSLDKRAPDTK
ncbi:cAMP receptor (Car4), partial [Penicillium riverlandense]|uniref:cAMP receptor (Car4) n=1 Tax=Penicillium riverlandense TaxID=1903569 RepID=UPI00254697A8